MYVCIEKKPSRELYLTLKFEGIKLTLASEIHPTAKA